MTKTYYFIDDSYYPSNGCNCCEPDYMPCLNINTEKHPDFAPTLGSAYSEEDMMEQVLIQEGLLDPYWYDDIIFESGIDHDKYVMGLFKENNLKIVIERNGGKKNE